MYNGCKYDTLNHIVLPLIVVIATLRVNILNIMVAGMTLSHIMVVLMVVIGHIENNGCKYDTQSYRVEPDGCNIATLRVNNLKIMVATDPFHIVISLSNRSSIKKSIKSFLKMKGQIAY